MLNIRMIFVPFVTIGFLDQALQKVPNPYSADVIFCHQQCYGCQINGRANTDGDKWFPNYPLLICGHIHTFHKVQDNLIYVGTPMQHDHGDDDNKALGLFSFRKVQNSQISEKLQNAENLSQFSAINNPIQFSTVNNLEYHLHRHPLVKVPKLLTHYIRCENLFNYIAPYNSIIRLFVIGTNEQIKAVCKSKFIPELKKQSVNVMFQIEDYALTSNDNTNNNINRVDFSSNLAKYINYKQALFNSIQYDEDLKSLFNELFMDLK